MTIFIPWIESAAAGGGGIDSYTKLACNFDSDLTDLTGRHTLTAYGGAAVDSGSLLLNGTTGYLGIPNSSDFQIADGAFSVEATVNIASFASQRCFFFYGNDGNTYNSLYFAALTGAQLNSIIGSASSTEGINTTGIATIPTSTWTHVYFAGDASYLYAGIGGTLVRASRTLTVGIPDVSPVTQIGALYGASYRRWFFADRMKWFRFSKGIARYTGDTGDPYTVPSGPWSV